MGFTNNIQQAQLWPMIIGNTSSAGMLRMAMRHVSYTLIDMVGRSFEVDNLHVETVPVDSLIIDCDDPEAETVGIYLLIDGDLSGEAILMLHPADAMYLSDWLLETRPGTTSKLDPLAYSALAEFGNVTLSSFLNSVADLTGIPLRVSPPSVVVDVLAVIFEAVARSADTTSDTLQIVKTDFVNQESSMRIQFWVVPDFAASTTPLPFAN
jgi:chemotaxis protein CheC